jgi:ditrans,polycis-polyprenyl diphosphate synthase
MIQKIKEIILIPILFIWSIIIKIAIKIIINGPIPSHVAFIMDGNRRWAKKNKLKKSEGHKHGYYKLEQVNNIHIK